MNKNASKLIYDFYTTYKDTELKNYSKQKITNIIQSFFKRLRRHLFDEVPKDIKLTYLGQFRLSPVRMMKIYFYSEANDNNTPEFVKSYIANNQDICKKETIKFIKRGKYGKSYKKTADQVKSIYEEIYKERLDA